MRLPTLEQRHVVFLLCVVGIFITVFDTSSSIVALPTIAHEFSTDLLGTYFFRTFFGFQLQLGDPVMGATVAGMMFLIILFGVCLYLFGLQRRLQRVDY